MLPFLALKGLASAATILPKAGMALIKSIFDKKDDNEDEKTEIKESEDTTKEEKDAEKVSSSEISLTPIQTEPMAQKVNVSKQETIVLNVIELVKIEDSTTKIINSLESFNDFLLKQDQQAEAQKQEETKEGKDDNEEDDEDTKQKRSKTKATTLTGAAALIGGLYLWKPDIVKEAFNKLIDSISNLFSDPNGALKELSITLPDQKELINNISNNLENQTTNWKLSTGKPISEEELKTSESPTASSDTPDAAPIPIPQENIQPDAEIISPELSQQQTPIEQPQPDAEKIESKNDLKQNNNTITDGNRVGNTSGISQNVFDRIKAQLKQHEGFSAVPYRDAKGWSIGYGHYINTGSKPESPYNKNNPLPADEAERLLDQDINKAIKHAEKLPGWQNANDESKIGLIDFMYNVGPGTAAKFKDTMAALQAGDFETAAEEILDSDYAKQVKGRAITVANQIRSTGMVGESLIAETTKNRDDFITKKINTGNIISMQLSEMQKPRQQAVMQMTQPLAGSQKKSSTGKHETIQAAYRFIAV
jgi:lysozyme